MMKNKKLIYLSFVGIVLGIILIVVGITQGGSRYLEISNQGFDFYKEDISDLKTVTISEQISSLEVDMEYSDVVIVRGDECSVDYDANTVEVTEEDGKLIIRERDEVQNEMVFVNLDMTGVEYQKPIVWIRIPSDYFLDECEITVESGDLDITNQVWGNLEIENDYGVINLENLQLDTLDITQDYGDFTLYSIDGKQVQIDHEYGNGELRNITCRSLAVKISSGALDCTEIDVDEIAIESEYGSVDLSVVDSIDNYKIDVEQEYGTLFINGDEVRTVTDLENEKGNRSVSVVAESGDVSLEFVE